MDLSIILVNYKSTSLVLDCLESIYKQTNQYSFEIILVDNDSKDDCKEIVLQHYPSVIFLSMDYNAGFAMANNTGIQIAKGEFFLLLNTDTIILDGAIDKSISMLKNYPQAVGCGVQLLNTDGSTQISGAHFIKGGLNTLLPLPYLGKLIRWLGYQLNSKIPSVTSIQDTIEVDWIVGAFMLIRKNAIEKSGLLDSDFFMYAEEIEWCARLRKQGKLLLFAEPKVTHIGGGTSGDYYSTTESQNGKNLWDAKGKQVMVSTMLRIRKQFGVGWFIIISATYLIEIPIFLICLLIETILKIGKTKYKFKNVVSYSSNMLVVIKLFFTILLNKPHFYKVS